MYKAIEMFTDLQDGDHKYEIGDTFPRKGKRVNPARYAELAGPDNKRGAPVIEKIAVMRKVKKPAAE